MDYVDSGTLFSLRMRWKVSHIIFLLIIQAGLIGLC
jgi:hypothetical protein